MVRMAVVLAAGRGGRLGEHTSDKPKCLVPVNGQPMIHAVLSSLAQAGVTDAVLVVGYHGEQLECDLGTGERFGLHLRYVWNHDYERGNASSFACALPVVAGEPFVLTMGDHVCDPGLLQALAGSADGYASVAVDRSELSPEGAAEATKVSITGRLVVDIGKHLERWHGIDTGFSYWPADAFTRMRPIDGELAAYMARVAQEGAGLFACDVTGHAWQDIDTADDMRRAERLLQSHERRLA